MKTKHFTEITRHDVRVFERVEVSFASRSVVRLDLYRDTTRIQIFEIEISSNLPLVLRRLFPDFDTTTPIECPWPLHSQRAKTLSLRLFHAILDGLAPDANS